MNENATMDWVENVLKTFTFGKRKLFAWDNFRAHFVQSEKNCSTKEKPTPLSFLVVHWTLNKPIKDQLKEMYDQWMNEGSHTHIKGGNMRGPPLKEITQWILKDWSDLDKVIIIKSFRCCVLCQYRMVGVRTRNCVFQTRRTTELWLRAFESCNGWSSQRASWSHHWIGHRKWSRSGYWCGEERRWRRWYWVNMKKTTKLSCVYFISLFFVGK